jgi:outer membrane protein assembly factor BamB
VLWTYDSKNVGTSSSPALFENTLYVGNDGLKDVFFYAFNLDGTVKWKYPVPKQIFSSPAVKDGVVYFHVRDDFIYALDARTGSLVWKAPAPSPQPFWKMVFMDPSKSSPVVAGERVFVGIDKNLTALDRATGKVLWQAPTGRKVDSTPLVVGDIVYVGSDDRSFYAFDAATGKRVWSFATLGSVSSSPNYGEGMIIVGSDDGALYAFEEDHR